MIRVFFICSEEESHGVHTGGYFGCLLRRFFFLDRKVQRSMGLRLSSPVLAFLGFLFSFPSFPFRILLLS